MSEATVGRKFRNLLILIAAIVAVTAAGTWYVMKPKPIVETAAVEEVQGDGSRVLARTPDKKAKPKQIVPKGSKVERVASFTVKPHNEACAPVTCDLSLVRLDDGSKRIIASSPDGEVIGGMDIPVETAAPPPEPKVWAAGLSYDPMKQTPGAWVERDIGRVRIGADINQVRVHPAGESGIETRLRVGVTF